MTASATTAPSDPHALWRAASAFAARMHRNQLRRDGKTPYFSHLARVAQNISAVFGCTDPTILAAAYLHDTIEDTTTDYEDIADNFGSIVADCVAALTKNMALREPEREDEYHNRLRTGPWQARLVKLADVLDNMADLVDYPLAERAEHSKKTFDRARHAVALLSPDDLNRPEFKAAVAAVHAALG
ncbi:MAG: HD domain-containing protein [Phycisphaerales bacterium]|jgi:guanosine-3',5'-bis(diphosphate) 3'-pyrophosphohydrolase